MASLSDVRRELQADLFQKNFSQKIKSFHVTNFHYDEIFRSCSLEPWALEKNERMHRSYSKKESLPKSKKSGKKLISISLQASKKKTGRDERNPNFIHHSNIDEYIQDYRRLKHEMTDAEIKLASQEITKIYQKHLRCKARLNSIDDEGGYHENYDVCSNRDVCKSDVDGAEKMLTREEIRFPTIESAMKLQEEQSQKTRFRDSTFIDKNKLKKTEKDSVAFRLPLIKNAVAYKKEHHFRLKSQQAHVSKLMALVDNPERSSSEKKCLLQESTSCHERDHTPDSNSSDECLTSFLQNKPLCLEHKESFSVGRSQTKQIVPESVSSVVACFSNFPSNKSQSMKEILLASIRNLQPFSKNGPEHSGGSRSSLEHSGGCGRSENLPPAGFLTSRSYEKQSISYQIYRSLSHNPAIQKHIQKFFIPTQECKIGANNSYFLSGRRLSNLPIIPIQNQHHDVTRRLNKRKKAFEKYREQRQLARKQKEQKKQLVALEPSHDNSTLAIVLKQQTVVKSQLISRNKVC